MHGEKEKRALKHCRDGGENKSPGELGEKTTTVS